MKLPKSFITVTLFSKIFTLVIFITFPIAAFFLGIYYQKSNHSDQKYQIQERIVKVYPTDSPQALIYRCGDIPENAYPQKNKFGVINGPVWSPDCRHIAWSLWESGISYISDDLEVLKEIENNPKKLSGREGVFIYSDATKTIKKLYSPTNLDETPEFNEWLNKEDIVFTTNNKKYKYNLTTQEILPL